MNYNSTAIKSDQIDQVLRERIVNGVLPPNSRLPTRVELIKEFDAAPVTVQKSLDRLRRDGFVVARGRAGTFVAARPPHLSRYAIAFSVSPDDRSLLYQAFTVAARDLEVATRCQLPLLFNVDGLVSVDGHVHTESMLTLLADLKHDRLAGVFFANPPYWLPGYPEPLGKARLVGFCRGWPGVLHGVTIDYAAFVDRALEHLAAHGRRRVAFLTIGQSGNNEFTDLHDGVILPLVARHGLETKPHWLLPCHPEMRATARVGVQLMLDASPADRPDALVVMDDHLVEEATRGLAAAHVRVPAELEVVGHCNYPVLPRTVAPVTFLGFDARETLTTALAVVDQLRRGQPAPQTTVIPPRFEHERPTAVPESPLPDAKEKSQ